MATRAEEIGWKDQEWTQSPMTTVLQRAGIQAIADRVKTNGRGRFEDQHWHEGTPEAMYAPQRSGANDIILGPDGRPALRVVALSDSLEVEGNGVSFEPQSRLAVSGQTIRRDVDPPPAYKGALWAQAPDSPDRGDVLLFSRYPSELSMQAEGNVVSTTVAGRSFNTLMNLGAKGVKIDLRLWFYDAFIDFQRYDAAEGAKLWFDAYVIGHDGSGAALPYVHTYMQLGSSPPVRVMIHAVDMRMSHFNRQDAPQSLQAQVQLEVYEPVYFVSPFKPKAPPQARAVKQRKKDDGCGETRVAGLPGPRSGTPIEAPVAKLAQKQIGGITPPFFSASVD